MYPTCRLNGVLMLPSDPCPLKFLVNPPGTPFEILFVMLTEVIVFPFALGIQYLHENEKTAKYCGVLYSSDVMRGTGCCVLAYRRFYNCVVLSLPAISLLIAEVNKIFSKTCYFKRLVWPINPFQFILWTFPSRVLYAHEIFIHEWWSVIKRIEWASMKLFTTNLPPPTGTKTSGKYFPAQTSHSVNK